MSRFDEEYGRLNEAQKRAVDTIEGPVMVVAGPGTGKTQVLSLRVANILRKTHMRPSNILCLTYTVTGTTAMRDRLRTIIGPDAYGVEICTIHGFCNDVIRKYPEMFDDFSALEQVSDVQRYRMLNRLLDEMPVGSAILNPKDRYGRTGDILDRFSEVKREGITTEVLRKVALEYEEEMQGKSREGTKAHARNVRYAKQFAEFVALFERYQEALREEGGYDYEDMILFVINALREDEWLRSILQEKYQYVLVDEYQDTNGAQNTIVELLTTLPDAVGLPNVFVVGDDDQAIFRFQGANVANMMRFRERFPSCPVITLTTSYRSTQEILDASMALIAHNDDRLVHRIEGIEKKMTSSAARVSGPKPELMRPVSDAVESFAIGEKISGLLEDGVRPSEIAVFTLTNRELFDLYDVLRGMDIPAQIAGKLNLLADEGVRTLLSLLKAVENPTQDDVLATALASPCFGCHPADLGILWTRQRERNRREGKEKGYVRLFDMLSELESSGDDWGMHDVSALKKGWELIIGLHGARGTHTLPALLERLMKKSKLLPATKEEVDPLHFVALQEFFDHVKSRCRESMTYDIAALLEDMEYRMTYGMRMTYAIPHLIDEGVQLMTAHSAKGLEFDTVFVMNFRDKQWSNKKPQKRLAIPDHLLFECVEKDHITQDERRLAYVAWTRAKHRLILSCPERITRGEKEQSVSPSQFFTEGGELPEYAFELKEPEKANILLLQAAEQNMDEAMRTFLRKKLETYELSVTALNTFLNPNVEDGLDGPQRFLMQELLGIPRAKTKHQAYGTAVHAALREWGMSVRRGEEYPLASLLASFSKAMEEREVLTALEREDMLHLGREALSRYYEARMTTLPIIYGIEKQFNARLDDVPLKGVLDRIDLHHPDGAKAHIIDYKTGKPKTEKVVREDRDGALFRQLVFYRILTELSPSFAGYEATEFSLDFIGEREDEPRLVTLTVTSEEVNELKDVIKKVWAKILALDFTPIAK